MAARLPKKRAKGRKKELRGFSFDPAASAALRFSGRWSWPGDHTVFQTCTRICRAIRSGFLVRPLSFLNRAASSGPARTAQGKHVHEADTSQRMCAEVCTPSDRTLNAMMGMIHSNFPLKQRIAQSAVGGTLVSPSFTKYRIRYTYLCASWNLSEGNTYARRRYVIA